MRVLKRDGTVVDFEKNKIIKAVQSATQSCKIENLNDIMDVADTIEDYLILNNEDPDSIIDIYDIQKMVEDELMDRNKDVARSYIEYRKIRDEERFKETNLIKKIKGIMNAGEIENENANVNEHSFSARKDRAGAEASKNYSRSELLAPSVKKAFLNGVIHIHDEDSYAKGDHNCILIDCGDILSRGFETKNGDVRPAGGIKSALQQLAVIYQCQSQNQFGGVASNTFDYGLSPFLKKTFIKQYKKGLKYFGGEKLPDNEIYIDNENIKDTKAYQYAIENTKEELDQGMEAYIHNLNTLESRAGSQVPFTSDNFGTDTSTEGRMINKAYLEARIRGVGKNYSTPIFPIGIFKYREDLHGTDTSSESDMFDLAIESLTKRIYPNFVNVTETWENPDEEQCTMGCRTLNGYDRNGFGFKRSGRGNVSPITINLPKLALDSKTPEKFKENLVETLRIVENGLLDRFNWQSSQKAKSAPFMYKNGIWKTDKLLKDNDEVREALKHGSLAMGYIGLAECMTALFGKHHGEDESVYEFALQTIKTIKEYADEASERNSLNFVCYATPAEGYCSKALDITRKQYGVIKGVTDREYFTNSHHIPVYFPCSIKDKLNLELPFTKLATGGCITYIELDGNTRQNKEAVKSIVRYAMKIGIPYLAINHPIDECTYCGYEGIIGNECPSCKGKDGEIFIKRLRRVTGYITNSYKEFFNKGKKAEVEDRFVHSKISDLKDLM